MKKSLNLILLLIFFVSCSDDDETKNELSGSVWAYEDICKLKFISSDKCHLFLDAYPNEEDSYFSYKYEYPNLNLYYMETNDPIPYKFEFRENGKLAIIDEVGFYLLEMTRQ